MNFNTCAHNLCSTVARSNIEVNKTNNSKDFSTNEEYSMSPELTQCDIILNAKVIRYHCAEDT